MANSLAGSSESHYPELLSDLRAQLVRMLKGEGLADDQAERIALHAAEHLRSHWGGQNVYFPQGLSHETRQRAIALYDAFNGTNLAALAQREGISTMTAYRWLRYARAEHVRINQGQLFGDETGNNAR
jgi:Mor family transcriptional regulator